MYQAERCKYYFILFLQQPYEVSSPGTPFS